MKNQGDNMIKDKRCKSHGIFNKWLIRIPEKDVRESGGQEIFNEKSKKNFPELKRDVNLPIQRT